MSPRNLCYDLCYDYKVWFMTSLKVMGSGVICLLLSSPAFATQGYYRGPSLANSNLVFSAEGDLWKAQLTNSGPLSAQRLTTHASLESQALISPNGRTVAFVANYQGNSEIYTMPIGGGVPQRISFEHASVNLQHWVDDHTLLYSTSSRSGAPSNWTMKTVDVRDLSSNIIPVADALSGYLYKHNNGQILFFVQFGIQIATDNTNFYRGGMAGKLWRYDVGDEQEASQLLGEHKGNIRDPMVYAQRLYFVSDASGRDNIWSTDFDGAGVRQETHFKEWSVREVSMAMGTEIGHIVFRVGADLHVLDLREGSGSSARKLAIEINSDHPEMRKRWVKQPLKYLTALRFADELDKVVLTARGRMAIAGTDQSRLVEVATPSTSRSRQGVMDAAGRWVYALNDNSGELEIWRFAADGSERAEQLTKNAMSYRRNLQLSGDGKWLTYADGLGGLWLLDIESKKNTQVLSGGKGREPIGKVAWSPDGQLFALAHTPPGALRSQILLHSIKDGRQAFITTDKYLSRAPTFSADGKWIYYLSERNFTPTPSHPWLDRDFGPSFGQRSVVMANALSDDAEFPFSHATELSLAVESAGSDDNAGDKGAQKSTKDSKRKKRSAGSAKNGSNESEIAASKAIQINWGAITRRLYQVPLPPNNYFDLAVNDERLYVLTLQATPEQQAIIETAKFDPTPKLTTFADKVGAMALSKDGKKLLVFKPDSQNGNHQISIVPAADKMPTDLSKQQVLTAAWQFNLAPKQEWQQIFHDAWFMHREMFFDRDMRGVDWRAMKQKYQSLLARITSRNELNDVFKQMMGELNALHSQVRGGDQPVDHNLTAAGLLGAELKNVERRGKNVGVEIAHIYRHDLEMPAKAPPLARVDVDAKQGDVIQAVNGKQIVNLVELYEALQNQVGKQVLLELQRNKESLKTVVVPNHIGAEAQYRYQDWVIDNRRKVEQADVRLGYLHLQSMVGRDVGNFVTEFHADGSKQGIIIDVRRNNGGNVDSWLVNHLMRQAWAFWGPRSGEPYVNMQNAFRGHLVVLADERTYSDGETFTAAIKKLGIADIIGKRTAGAGVWLTSSNRQSDGGIARVAEFPVFDMQGQWIVEGHGVTPTIEVTNYPYATFIGHDAQLQTAIEYLQEKIKREPIPELSAKPFPRGLLPGLDVQ